MIRIDIKKRSLIAGVLICCILCSVTIYVSSHRFVNEEITPKWLGMMLSIGIMGLMWSMFCRKIYLPARPIDAILIICLFLVFVSEWVTSGALLIYPVVLLLLYFLVQRVLSICSLQYLFGTVVIFAVVLSLHGILQYAGLTSSGSNNFAVIGSFDNPAGFAAALACALPLCFLFFNDQSKYLRYAAITATVIIAIAVFLSGSRAGILAIVAATAVWLLVKSKIGNLAKRSHERSANRACEPNEVNHQKLKIVLAVFLVVLPVVLYFAKKDSADGRLFIWRCALDMVADQPVLGHGKGAFQAKYMLYQADYINAHPDSRYAQLADNVLHPFNEYLLVLCEYGIVGLSVITLLGFLLFGIYRKNCSDEKLPALLSLLSLAIFSFFSYPFKYPFTWVMLLLNIAVICYNPGVSKYSIFFAQRRSLFFRNIPRMLVFLLSAGLFAYSAMLTRSEIKWKRIAHQSLAGRTTEVLPQYDKLYRLFGKDGLFLYNHAAELHVAKEYERSIAVFERCTRYYNDMDVQMLLADNYKALGKYAEAEEHLKLAASMCPVRFMPLYELAKLYNTTGRRDEALILAKEIMDKDIKVPSPTINVIKNEMRQLIGAPQTTKDTTNRNRTNHKLNNDQSWQGETPEVQPHGAALPP